MKHRVDVNVGEVSDWISKWTRRLFKQGGVNDELPELLVDIGAFVSADRCFIYRSRNMTETFDLTCEWWAPGIDEAGRQVPTLTPEDMPALSEKIFKSEAVILSTKVAESTLAVPFKKGEEIAGFMGFQSITNEREWAPSTVTFLSAVAGMISAALDEDSAALKEEHLQGFLEASLDYVGIVDSESLQLIYLNPAGRKLIGLGPDKSLKGITADRITPESMQKLKKESIYHEVERNGSWHGEAVIREIDSEEEIPVLQTLLKFPHSDCPSGYGIGSIIRDLRKERANEQRFTDSERLLQSLVAAAPHALYLLNYADSRMAIGEESIAQITGYSTEELRNLENGVYDLVHPDDKPAVQAQETALAQSEDGKVISVVFRFLRKDGHWDWLEVHSKVFERDENGRPITEVGMAQVITGRKLAEDKLRYSEDRIERAVLGSNDGIWDSDLMTGTEWWSARLYDMLGLESGEIPATRASFVELLHPDDRDRVAAHLGSHLEKRTAYDISYRLRLKSGKYRWFRGRGETIRDENGIAIRMAGSTQDVEEQKQLELRLEREAEINQVIFHVTNGFVFVLDPDGYTVRWNRSAKELTGQSESEFRKTPLWDLLFPAGSRQHADMLEEVEYIRNSPRYFRMMRKIWRKNGSTRTVEMGCSGTYNDHGELLNIVLVGFDLSKHQRLQREVIRISEQEQLRIGADLHDGLGQFLTGVSDLSEALSQRTTDPHVSLEAGKIYTLARAAVFEVRRMSQGLTPASIENRGLAGSLRHLAESVEDQSKVKCTVKIEDLEWVRETEMETHLFRIAQEAVNNALKHSQADTIEISYFETENESILRIEDNGIGIKSEEPAEPDRGVGLTVMEYRVGLMGGDLLVENRAQGGTRIECRLLVDFDRLDRLKSGRVQLYRSRIKA